MIRLIVARIIVGLFAAGMVGLAGGPTWSCLIAAYALGGWIQEPRK